ncbi:MAG: hydroxyacid dehydrogenase [Candidatus Yanofskybacteria bacterium CG10_big_fil_rev_8_21_14_0_10_36_16]|uniref:Hydroxyacid dehydrogenase n=1 Tax=Candidatus Yanofskybacteria bacterium CG10_big_fil_rev_8_21_14_0_10_36_16 TaxID=1975096 RepID=A0A2J0Q6Z3_9BACT|nr:MAG: hydroxyacid dehydrogenase [Candidatus Yanofskybacteria bacterium CG10_big_fil_rev_8_21_14_0_10_36_16]
MRIAFFKLEDWQKEFVQSDKRLEGHDFLFYDTVLDKDNLPEDASVEAVCVFVNSMVDKEVLEKLPNLKLVVTRSTGYDHIDLEACTEKGVAVANVPAYGENTVAEFAFSLITALARKIPQSYHRIREEGSWNLDGLRGFDLKGKTLGVVGTGRIGKYAIKIANGYGMKVIGFDAFPNEEMAKELGFEYQPLEDTLKNSDVVTIHVPYLKETHHLINKDNIGLMKKGAYLVNTSRGAVVETEALFGALKSGHLGGAGLDVFEEEGPTKDELTFLVSGNPAEHDLKILLQNHALIDMPNVIVTPHNAFNTQEAIERILNTTVEDLKGFIDGKPVNIV